MNALLGTDSLEAIDALEDDFDDEAEEASERQDAVSVPSTTFIRSYFLALSPDALEP